MPNSIGPTGLETQTRDELLAFFIAAYQAIYGSDINLDQDSPDGQMMNIFIQAILDLEDLLVQINNMFDPDNAVGVILDQRVAINGIQRQAGTFTITNISVVTNQACSLFGLDQDAQPIYTVQDNAGNKWLLETTQFISGATTTVASFRAELPGASLTVPNTITIPVTIVLGVVSVNNPTIYTTLGINEESDAELKVRRQKSVSLASQGYLAGLLAALENITGVTSAFVYENNTDATNVDGVPSHTIWVIIAGTAADVDIATAIYDKRNAGCGMFGNTSYVITQVDGTPFVVYWDTVITESLYIAFTAASIDGINAPNIAAIREGLAASFVPGVHQSVNINQLSTLVQSIDPNTLVTGAGFSVAKTQVLSMSGVPASGAFKLNYNGVQTASINWNDSTATIQSKLQAVTGLGGALVTGSLASQSLTIDLSALNDVLTLVTASNNTLQTSGPIAITFAYNEGYANTLTPSTKRFQFVVSSPDIIITPMILSPPTATVPNTTTKAFAGLGGYGTLVYSIQTNNSGASINASSGLYTAGPTPATDTLLVTDALGNTATAVVTVT